MTESHRDDPETPDSTWPAWCRRVAVVAPRYPEVSGGARYVENLGTALADLGVEVSIFSVYRGAGQPKLPTTVAIEREQLHRNPVLRGRMSLAARLSGIPRIVYKRWDRRRYRRRFRAALEAYGSDSIIIFTHAIAKLALDETGFSASDSSALLVGQHHSSFESLRQEPGLKERILRAFADIDVFTALSEEDAERFAALLSVPCRSVDNIAAPAEAVVAPAGGRERTAVALVRLSDEKQIDLMIRAFVSATSDADLQDWRLDIYGEGELRPELEGVIGALGAGARVRLRGVTDSPSRVLSAASVNLLTSRYEGFPYSVLEAAQMATPSIAFDCSPGLRRLMVNVHGRLVPPAAGEAGYAAELQELLRSPLSLMDLGEEARRGAARFSAPQVIAQWARILDQVRAR